MVGSTRSAIFRGLWVARLRKCADAQGQDYPSFSRDNVRWECNRKLLGSTQVFYESAPGFHGKDSVSIEVRFPSAGIRTVDIDVTVL